MNKRQYSRLKKIVRHGTPGTLDEAPHGTACFVQHGKEHYVYVQVSKTEIPRWEFMGVYPDPYSKKELKKDVEKFKTLKF